MGELRNSGFVLSEQDEARAQRLLNRAVCVDMVNFHPGGQAIFDEAMEKEMRAELARAKDPLKLIGLTISIPYRREIAGQSARLREFWRESNLTGGTFAVHSLEPRAFLELVSIYTELTDSLPWMRKAICANDFRAAKAQGGCACYYYCQPVSGIPKDLDIVRDAYRLGLRSLMLTYNRQDYAGTGCTEKSDGGVSAFGRDVIQLLNELDVILDVSHCGARTTLDACEISEAPVTANHTSVASLYAHARAKSDEEIQAIADTDGLVGICAVPFFLSGNSSADLNTMLDHIDYVSNLVGWRHVGFGSDWPPQAPAWALEKYLLPASSAEMGFRPEDKLDVVSVVKGYEDARSFPDIVRGLIKRGYEDKQIEGIVGGNFLRVFEQVCG